MSSEIRIGDIVKFSDKDEKGNYSIVGEYAGTDDYKNIILITFWGTMVLPEKTTKLTKESTPPTGWKKFRQDPMKFHIDEKAKATRKDQKVREETKTLKEKIFDIVAESSDSIGLSQLLEKCRIETGADIAIIKTQVKLALLRINRD